MNINNIIQSPAMFRDKVQTRWAVCEANGDIYRIFEALESAKVMTSGSQYIQEVFVYKGDVISIGEILLDNTTKL